MQSANYIEKVLPAGTNILDVTDILSNTNKGDLLLVTLEGRQYDIVFNPSSGRTARLTTKNVGGFVRKTMLEFGSIDLSNDRSVTLLIRKIQ